MGSDEAFEIELVEAVDAQQEDMLRAPVRMSPAEGLRRLIRVLGVRLIGTAASTKRGRGKRKSEEKRQSSCSLGVA